MSGVSRQFGGGDTQQCIRASVFVPLQWCKDHPRLESDRMKQRLRFAFYSGLLLIVIAPSQWRNSLSSHFLLRR
jgi:hypothetical protein